MFFMDPAYTQVELLTGKIPPQTQKRHANKHSKTKTATVQVSLIANGLISIQVNDSGAGCLQKINQGTKGHNGLFRIQERADSLGGSFKITREPGKGTCAALILPCGN